MPETRPAVERLLALLPPPDQTPITLLVVPGRDWDAAGIAWLAGLQQAGYRLAGHGWRHEVAHVRRLYHRLHSLLISRRVAEHLDLDAGQIVALVNRNHAWFGEHGLAPPDLYVPPAWALGPVPHPRLADACPFALYELFGGVLDAATGQRYQVPLLGYEADRPARVPVIRAWNAINRARARRVGLIRIGIHPFDAGLHLAADLAADLARYPTAIDYPALLAR